MDDKLFEYLLSKPETKIIDFKKDTYDFSKNKDVEDAKLVKDILSFANTIRTETAYIIAGVTIDKGNKTLYGIAGMLDDASLQQKVKSKIQLTPHFLSYDFPYKGKIFGIIEIPVYAYTQPLWPIVAMKGCEVNKVYHRVGSSNTEAKADEILEISAWLTQLREASLPPPAKPIIEELDHYIERTVTPADGDPIAQMLLDHDSLEIVLQKHKKIALLGWGLSGKSTELKRIAHRLSLKDDAYVYLIPLSNHVDEPIASHIVHIDRIKPANLIVLLDGLDEVLPAEFETARRHVSQFVHDYPDATVVVSCRTNFYVTDPGENGLSTLNNFDSYRLDNLKQEAIDRYLDETYPKDKTTFLQEIRKKDLQELLTLPYYLVKLSRQFNIHHKIAGSKAELFQTEIKELIAKDIAKTEHAGREVFEKDLFDLFKELAFIMEAKGTNTISTVELAEIFSDKKDFRSVMNAGSVFFGTDSTQKTWRFNHNNTQEYLAAQVLADLPFSKIKRIIGNRPDYNRIKPSWVNTLSFLNSILRPDAPLKRRITQWMVKYNRELVITLEPENITDELRYEVFANIFNDFKRKKRHINRNIFKIEDLAKFSECPVVFDFLLKELRESNNNASIANALNVVNHFVILRYPGYPDAFKPLYQKFLFGDKTEHHYLALVGYISLFTLKRDEFGQVFEKYRDSNDTWIRYQFFMGIWLTNNQDWLVAYLLEQARFLMTEDRRDKRRNNNELRLSNEYQEIANCLKQLKGSEALTILFTEIKKDFLAFSHSVYFGKIFENALENAAYYPKETTLLKAIDDLFLEHHSYVLHDNQLKVVFPRYCNSTTRTDHILKLLYSTKGLTDHSVGYTIGAMANRSFIDYLFKEHQEGRVSSEPIDMVYRFIEHNENPNEEYFRQVFKMGKKPEAVVRDFKKEEIANQQRNLKALFNKGLYIQEIKKIFDAFGKETLTYEDRYSHREPNFGGPEFCEVAREALGLHPHGADAILKDILENIERKFDVNFIYRVYAYLVKHREAKLSADERKLVTDWCDGQVKLVNFKEAITQHTPFDWTCNVNAQILSFFIRFLRLKHYGNDVYLDMLSFLKNGDSLVDITTFVDETIGFEKTRGRIIDNLNSGILNSQLIKSHVDYVVQHEIVEAADLLLQYFNTGTSADKYQLLKAYVDLKGDIEKLQTILEQSDSYFQNSLIEQFLRAESPTIEAYLKKKFAAETDRKEKLNYSKYLIRLQDREALRYYIDYLKQVNSVPDDSSPVNPLYSLRKVIFTWPIINLYETAQQPQFHSDSFCDLRNITATTLQNIALYNGNFPNVKRRIKLWMVARQLVKKIRPMPINLIKDIEFFLENFAKQFYVTRVVMLSQQEAIMLYRKIIKK